MARWNPLKRLRRTDTEDLNLAGGEAFPVSERLELVSILLTSFAEDQYYRSGSETVERLTELINALGADPFVAKAAILARDWGMRSITHVAAAELCVVAKGQPWLRSAVSRIIRRPDDATEIVAYWLENHGKPLPNALKRGVADAVSRFDDYSLAKYRAEGHKLKLVDLVNLVHASSPSIDRLMQGTLQPPDTWEVKLTQAEGDAALRAVEWTRLVSERKLGYFALLRNLRNLERWAPGALPGAWEQLTDPAAIARSKVLPFRFTTAAREVEDPRSLGAIAEAAEIALGNLSGLGGSTLVALDCSASMRGRPLEIGALFAAAFAKRLAADLLCFGDKAYRPRYNPRDTLLTIAEILGDQELGGTDFRLIFNGLDKPYERIVILSDMQAWVGVHAPLAEFARYRGRTKADPAVWSFDLRGYGSLQFPERNVFALAGFSEKVFDLMPMVEADPDSLVRAVDEIAI